MFLLQSYLYSSCWPFTLHGNPLAEFPVGKFNIERSKLYEKMAAELDEKGPAFLGDGETSQSLKVHIIASIYDPYVCFEEEFFRYNYMGASHDLLYVWVAHLLRICGENLYAFVLCSCQISLK